MAFGYSNHFSLQTGGAFSTSIIIPGSVRISLYYVFFNTYVYISSYCPLEKETVCVYREDLRDRAGWAG